jgi:cytochrome d ubiquinol oxidase subunit I
MELDTLMLSRLQFALNISFHILFPVITIALGWVLVYFRVMHTKTGDASWEAAYYRAVKMFALTFALGVVSGITMSFQFGTNWPGFMEKAGDVAGPLLGYEVLSAFFLEASFLGVMLYGRERVSNRVHIFASVMVSVGTLLSAFWILVLNSWMQTPVGYSITANGHIVPEDWLAILFNPSLPYRFFHMILASFLTVAFLLAGLSALRLLRGFSDAATHKTLRTSIWLAALIIPVQIFVGDLHGLNTLKYQPAKVAAMEAVWYTERGTPFTIFALPNEETQSNDYAIEIPYAASLVLTHKLDGEIVGLSSFADVPPVAPVFFSFRVMVGVGMLMLVISWFSVWRMWRERKKRVGDEVRLPKWLLKVFVWMTFSGWVATLAGWYVTEIGRQPWIVYGLLRVKDIVAPHPAGMVLSTFIGYCLVYVFLLVAYISVMRHLALNKEES